VGDSDGTEAAAGLYDLTRKLEPGLPLSEGEVDQLFSDMSGAIRAAYDAEVEAHAALQETLGGTAGSLGRS
jgi:hypothetical protein